MAAIDVDPIIRFADSAMVIAHWHNSQIIDLGGRLTLEHVRVVKMNHSLLMARWPNVIAAITTVRPTVPMSEKAVHDELAKMLKEHRESGINMKASVVYEAGGIVGTAIRAVARTLSTISGNRLNQIVSTVDQGVMIMLPWVRTAEGEAVTKAAVEHAISKVRAAYERQIIGEAAHRSP
jgi:hypothetical protein